MTSSAPDKQIEVATAQDVEGDEFDARDFDSSTAASTSITSSLVEHSYENGRRVGHVFNTDRGLKS